MDDFCMVVCLQKIVFYYFCGNVIYLIILQYVLNISVIQCIHFKKQLINIMVILEELSFRDTICNITQEPQELQRYLIVS